MTNLEAALAYAARGWPVLPIKPGTKVPDGALAPRGVLDATADERVLRIWFADHPKLGVAIATGAPGPDVLDVDDPEGAPAEVERLPAPAVSSSRGIHLYFTGTDQRTIKLPYGELRRKGSYVLAPPTVHPSGETYRWEHPERAHAFTPAPAWITEGRQTAGAGAAPLVDRVPPGAMYDHLLDLSVRLARAGMLDRAARVRALNAEFEARRVPGATYGGTPADTERLADAPSEILQREAERTYAPPEGGAQASPDRKALRFQTPAELVANLPSEPPWLWRGTIAKGLLTVVGGKPKVGKSTVIYEAINRMARGDREFLGAELTQTDVVILSEEHAITATRKLDPTSRKLHMLTRDFAWPMPNWTEALSDSLAAAREYNASLLVVDSFTFWADLEADQGKDSGAVQERLKPLIEAAHDGIGVLLIHHQRKAGGEFGDALLGSTAFAANADIIMEVERLGEGAPGHMRRIMRLGRWPVSPVLLATWTDDTGYQLVAEAESSLDAEDLGWAARISEVLRKHGRPMRQTELEPMLGVDGRTWARGAAILVERGEARREGIGGVKDPITYSWIPPEDRRDEPAI